MNDEIEILRSALCSEADFQRAEHWWTQVWSKIPNSSTWTSPWLSNRFADGTPMYHGSPILSAKNERLGRALRIIQEEPENGVRGHLIWWKDVWDPDYDNLLTLAITVITPSIEAIWTTEAMLSKWATGQEVEHKGERWWNNSEKQ